MKQWTGAGFPLALILTLAALTAWLQQAVELPDDRDGKHRHDPDYVIDGARISRLDDNGRMQYTIRAERLVHFPDDDSTEVTHPHLVYLDEGLPPTTLTAQRARITSGGDEVTLTDKVEVQRAATPTQAALLARTTRLTLFPDVERAITDAPVEITQGRSWVRGTGMELDNDARIFVLKSKVTGQIEAKRSRNQ